MQLRMLLIPVILFFGCVFTAQAQYYAGVLGGVSTLSGDARSVLSPSSTAFSSYDSKNGGAVQVLVGRHFSDYFALQADYIWNRNALTLTARSLPKPNTKWLSGNKKQYTAKRDRGRLGLFS